MALPDTSKKQAIPEQTSAIKPTLTLIDAIAITVGIVIGAGIFETPALVAQNVGSATQVTLLWTLGGVISLIGALCYAELSTAYPHPGGNYFYLIRAFGRPLGFLFVWARMLVLQPGSIVLLAFVFGDYATQILSLGPLSASLYAVVAIAFFTWLNLLGIQQGKWTQNLLTTAEVTGLLIVTFIGFFWATSASTLPPDTAAPPSSNIGLAMVFVLLSYGGWNEAAYISSELQNIRRNMLRSLLWSIGIISVVYLLINLAYLHGLGISGMATSKTVAADLMRRALGEPGVWFISGLVCIASLGSINATILTGARTNYALGQDFSLFSSLASWQTRGGTPRQALLIQAAISLVLVLLGSLGRNGFETMVAYTAPAFWFFFLMTGVSLFILRSKDATVPRPFRVPLYPITPILFCLACGYLLYSSLTYATSLKYMGIGTLTGLVAVLSGIPVLGWIHFRT
jgi:basic amino acid/polyamine antiporter, APA family